MKKIIYSNFLVFCMTIHSQIVWKDITQDMHISQISTMQDPVFKILQACYECEFSPITKTTMNQQGEYDQKEIASHWASAHDMYVLYYKDIPAGLCVVNKSSMIGSEGNVYDIGEFFIMPLYRQNKLGTIFAHAIFKLYGPKWEIRQLAETKDTARAFWLKVIHAIPHKKFEEEVMDQPQWSGFVQKFELIP